MTLLKILYVIGGVQLPVVLLSIRWVLLLCVTYCIGPFVCSEFVLFLW